MRRAILIFALACLAGPAAAQEPEPSAERTDARPGSGQRIRAPGAAPVLTIEQALESTRQNNISWRSLGEFLVQAEAGKDIGWGLLLPKAQAEVQWLHMGERHSPDMSALADMGALLGELVMGMIEEHPAQAARFEPYMDMMSSDSGGTFDAFVPKKDTISGTFNLVVPVLQAEAIAGLGGIYDRADAALQQVGHGREMLLYGVAKAYYGLCTVQNMIAVTDRSIDAAREHHRSSRVRANLQVATQLEVKRAELEVAKAESQKIELVAGLGKAMAAFQYLAGVEGAFSVVEPELVFDERAGCEHWQALARKQRKDLAAARIEAAVAKNEVDKIWMKYVPTINLIGQFKLDNNERQRFDDDPFSWTVLATMSVNIWDGGIREAQMELAQSQLRQADMKVEDLERDIRSKVSAAHQALTDARASHALAERQLEVARDTQKLALASEKAGVATNLEVIDANTMVFASEAQLIGARLGEAMAVLDLLSACGSPLPFE
ncbi:MAG: TolC family protein [Deltaproteobacteria bacterium]|nr:TolC family protein [Deltaproteobacteria bacterium]